MAAAPVKTSEDEGVEDEKEIFGKKNWELASLRPWPKSVLKGWTGLAQVEGPRSLGWGEKRGGIRKGEARGWGNQLQVGPSGKGGLHPQRGLPQKPNPPWLKLLNCYPCNPQQPYSEVKTLSHPLTPNTMHPLAGQAEMSHHEVPKT